jgi:ribonuclease VapC
MTALVKNYVLDSYAILTYFQDEAGAQLVQQLLSDSVSGEAELFISSINLGEIAYIARRKAGQEKAEAALSAVDLLPIKIVDVDKDLALGAAEIKADYPISYAGCFALALAERLEGIVVTGDPEFQKVNDLVPIQWLPPNKERK